MSALVSVDLLRDVWKSVIGVFDGFSLLREKPLDNRDTDFSSTILPAEDSRPMTDEPETGPR